MSADADEFDDWADLVSTDRLRVLAFGGVCGVLAYLSGYLVTYAVVVRRVAAITADLGLAVDPATWKVVGWAYYAAHFSHLVVPGEADPLGTSILATSDALSLPVVAIPVLSLLVFGLVAGRLTREDTADAGATVGVALLVGYSPLALLGLALFRASSEAGVASPEPMSTVLFVALIFPAVFGMLGGITGART